LFFVDIAFTLNERDQKGAPLALDELRQSQMMNHLLDALDKGEDIGHYGRLTFAMVAHHFLDREELVEWLTKDGDTDENEARALVQQVEEKGYNPPKRERILEWQEQQEFPICPNPDDPDACNVYTELNLPDEVFENIQEYQEKRQAADA
jgi:RecA-family ATPase